VASHPTNDYKTSVLAGLSPAVVLDICGRAISFWQYQIHQENIFQQAVLKNVNDKSTQLQKQLDNVIREANNEINILTTKLSSVEHDLDVERLKQRELQANLLDKDKEYQKLKNHYDRIKRKALLGLGVVGNNENWTSANTLPPNFAASFNAPDLQGVSTFIPPVRNRNHGSSLSQVVDGMEANGRTPLRAATGGMYNLPLANKWQAGPSQRQRMPGFNMSDRSDSVKEVEGLLSAGQTQHPHMKQNPQFNHFPLQRSRMRQANKRIQRQPLGHYK